MESVQTIMPIKGPNLVFLLVLLVNMLHFLFVVLMGTPTKMLVRQGVKEYPSLIRESVYPITRLTSVVVLVITNQCVAQMVGHISMHVRPNARILPYYITRAVVLSVPITVLICVKTLLTNLFVVRIGRHTEMSVLLPGV